eukprot:scaffold91450_cov53-Phaeocystis_antarctica.AAC.2
MTSPALRPTSSTNSVRPLSASLISRQLVGRQSAQCTLLLPPRARIFQTPPRMRHRIQTARATSAHLAQPKGA